MPDPKDSNRPEGSSVIPSRSSSSYVCNVVHYISVEPLLAVSMFTIVMYSIISQQFIYHQIAIKYGVENLTDPSSCESNNYTHETIHLLNLVSAETSSWILYLNIAGFIPSFIFTLLFQAWGDTVGRKAPLVLSFVGFFLMILCYLLVVHYNLHVSFLLIGRIVAGLSGDFNCILASCYAYIADTSSSRSRTFKVAIGEASTGIGGLLASVLSGIWINAQGFQPPLWLLLALLLTSIVYIVFVLDESMASCLGIPLCGKIRLLFSCNHIVKLWKFLSENQTRTIKVFGISFCFFLQLCIHDGTGDVIVVYELSSPFCWTSLFVGLGSAVRDISYLVGVATIKCLSTIFSDLKFMFLSTASGTTGLFMYGFATATWMLFTGYSLAIFRTINATVLRSMMSRLVGKDSQGTGFAVISCMESLAALAGSLVFNKVYSATVHDFQGAVFLLGAGLQILFFIFAWIVSMVIKSDLVADEAQNYRSLSLDQD